jgi:quercetin dioxygenase-like cupin family protein
MMPKYLRTAEDPIKSAKEAAEERYPNTHQGQLSSWLLVGPGRIHAKYDLGNLNSEHLEISVDTYEPGGLSYAHNHPEREQAYYILAGQAEVHVGGEVRVLGPGSTALISPAVEHSFRGVGDAPLKLMVISSYL